MNLHDAGRLHPNPKDVLLRGHVAGGPDPVQVVQEAWEVGCRDEWLIN